MLRSCWWAASSSGTPRTQPLIGVALPSACSSSNCDWILHVHTWSIETCDASMHPQGYHFNVTSCFSTPSGRRTVSLSIFSVTSPGPRGSFRRISTGFALDQPGGVEQGTRGVRLSRRRITLVWAAFSACTTLLGISFISPGRITSLTPDARTS